MRQNDENDDFCVKNRYQNLEEMLERIKTFFWNKQGNIRTKICLTTKREMKKKTFEKLLN